MYYEIGDIANTGTPKAGVFAEGGAGRIGRVDVDFFSGPTPTGAYHAPSVELRADKDHFGASRRARWFGL
jgi:sulfide:quinone oxidoreductase